jgi:hypothetical protein
MEDRIYLVFAASTSGIGLKPIVREFKKKQDVTEIASMRLYEMIRRKFCAIGLNGACSQRLPSHNNNESR